MSPQEYYRLRRDRDLDDIIRRAIQQDYLAALKRAESRYEVFL